MIKDVLTTETVAQINALIDEHAAFKSNGALVSKASALAGSVRPDGRHTMSGMLSWAEPLSAPFRELLWHPKLHVQCQALVEAMKVMQPAARSGKRFTSFILSHLPLGSSHSLCLYLVSFSELQQAPPRH